MFPRARFGVVRGFGWSVGLGLVLLGIPLACGGGDGGGAGGGASGGLAAAGGKPGSGGGNSGGSSSGGSSSGGGLASGGSNQAGGSGGAAGGSGGQLLGGQAGSLNSDCPVAVPQDGVVPCLPGTGKCLYLDCSGDGEVTASCEGGVYRVTAAPCESFACAGDSCEPGQICAIRSGGAYLGECVDNLCGDDPVDCSCAMPDCGGQCSIQGEPGYGIRAVCNTCPSGLCP